jgi:SAM-dependent methyltransferase
VDRWRRRLAAWEIPAALLEAVPWSPYEWAVPIWRRRTQDALDAAPTPTLRAVLDLSAPGDSVLDVGAGAGRYALAIARSGRSVTALEPDDGMRHALVELAGGLPVAAMPGSWPEDSDRVPRHAVVLCANVVYNVGAIAPFLAALARNAEKAVVIELTSSHPWVHLGRYFQRLHGLARPSGPRTSDLLEVIQEVLEVRPELSTWTRPAAVSFESIDELVEFYARRLVLTEDRWPELAALLRPEAKLIEGRWQVGPTEREYATLWWAKPNSTS